MEPLVYAYSSKRYNSYKIEKHVSLDNVKWMCYQNDSTRLVAVFFKSENKLIVLHYHENVILRCAISHQFCNKPKDIAFYLDPRDNIYVVVDYIVMGVISSNKFSISCDLGGNIPFHEIALLPKLVYRI